MEVSVRLKIKSLYNGLSAKEQNIADYILENPISVAHNSISYLSDELNVADSTLFQFAKKLGYSGFKEFKMAILIEENNFSTTSIHEKIEIDDNELTMAQKVFDSNIKTLTNTKKILGLDDLKKAAEIISNSNLLYFFGVGGSGILAEDAYHKFLRSPAHVRHSTDYHIQLMEASLLTPQDCAICISHTGKSKETIRIAEIVKEAGAKVIVITSHASSPLAKIGDVVFISISEEIEFHSEALSSRISQLSILDSLYVILMFMNKEKSKEALSKVRRTIWDVKH
ncbi:MULTISPECIES: MurR/RpiR family transcriptional regulator [Clostridium]|jgi:transcriptional regulator, RpiR family|uniref:MurR/RpiR family transcriptional regulator n=3 Tax=Clostridium beijerinckii TaxID=1520 RepID=A0AAE2RSM3_CLOBE|nr:MULTISPECIES: MurR/RpiR family transcriptional regulator [Clostridium]ABR34358.1 transcriptional regulator, RpiR family [Clostridium beijerinckii NCIMB 8052]AIU02557.1 RpiR family transcriptional regulator [Clostridium beijerinckii ATCC 35702]MBF7811025.1 MurR/RpiR family transcriptional regulator [Clostridium beijerinckii]NRT24329.1 DNA-binding MurR/RpiR family transcriptional regulator [Clostridium beijerinckii]NRT68081.1 DNA-binding MurR/RpiR family transcriptional regulator [Clostridium